MAVFLHSVIGMLSPMFNMLACPGCGNCSIVNQGKLPDYDTFSLFGGSPSDVKLDSGYLFRCLECNLYFRYPYPEQSVLTRLYQKLPDSVWACEDGRPIWKEVEKLLNIYNVNNTILDVGCFSGDFLNNLEGNWEKLGVEPNYGAREIAQTRGIKLIGETIDNIQVPVEPLGAIVLLDVIEHIHQPLLALQKLQRLLAPGGSIILFTGSTDTLPWHLFGSNYWYSSLPEHITFYSLRWFQWAASQLNMRVTWHRYFSSEPSGLNRWLFQFTRLALYTAVQKLRQLGVPERLLCSLPMIQKAARWNSLPWWQSAKDHILIVLSS